MSQVLALPGYVTLVVHFATLVLAIYTFVISLTYSTESYAAAGKWTKQGWTIVLGVGAVLSLFPVPGLRLINLAFTIAALVFLADVRPALAGLRRR